MIDSNQLVRFCWMLLGLCWTVSATAAKAAFVTDLSTIPLGALFPAMVLAVVSGGAATLQKIASPDVKVEKMALVVSADIASSLIAGMIAFAACSYWKVDPFLAFIAITVCAWGNARVLERILGAGFSQIDRYAGKPGGTP